MSPVIRLTTPGEIAAAIPHLCGFVPAESLVAVSLRGQRRRIGMTMRVDLPADADGPAAPDELGAAEEIAARLALDDPAAAVLVVYTGEPSARPRAALVDAVTAALGCRGIEVLEALLVRAGRWWSYTCDSECCPAAGTPLGEAGGELAASSVFDGRAVLPDREALVASLAPPSAEAVRGSLETAARASAQNVRRRGRAATRCEATQAIRSALGQPPADIPGLIVGLQDVYVRDEVATLALDCAEQLLALLLVLAQRSVAPYDVPVCTLIALVAWVRGDGALANVALDRALAGDRDCTMALLLRAGLDGQLPPKAVRQWLRQTRSALRRVA
ncbi:MAG: hypothetical protein NVSMB55_06680 [Mycobacteriales bacterium]